MVRESTEHFFFLSASLARLPKSQIPSFPQGSLKNHLSNSYDFWGLGLIDFPPFTHFRARKSVREGGKTSQPKKWARRLLVRPPRSRRPHRRRRACRTSAASPPSSGLLSPRPSTNWPCSRRSFKASMRSTSASTIPTPEAYNVSMRSHRRRQ